MDQVPSGKKWNLHILEGTNGESSPLWHHLRLHHHSDIISTTTTIPAEKKSDGSPNPAYNASWLEKNWMMLVWIQSTVAVLMFSLVMGRAT